MTMNKTIFTTLMLASFSGIADYQVCNIANGQIMSCSGWAQTDSTPVLRPGGDYENCSIYNGQVFSCSGWAQTDSTPVLRPGGDYENCSIYNGQVFSCSGWYQGSAIIDN
ncbi:hypothetical protein EGM70_13965 [Enterobacteriaceae bacterium 89]|nr:hypothetical protein [Enterobacteriaceae bacterium 89]